MGVPWFLSTRWQSEVQAADRVADVSANRAPYSVTPTLPGGHGALAPYRPALLAACIGPEQPLDKSLEGIWRQPGAWQTVKDVIEHDILDPRTLTETPTPAPEDRPNE